jgi:hypothetical protein
VYEYDLSAITRAAHVDRGRLSPPLRTLLLVGALLTLSLVLAGHSGFPAQAPLREPRGACVAYDLEVPIAWTDSDSPTPFGPAFIDIFATREDLPTFDVGRTPALPRPPIFPLIPEPDATNRVVWRTSSVTAGHYHLWTVVVEPPQEVASIQITERTPQVVTIVHGDSRVGPSVAITRPNSPLATSSGEFELRYSACDPTGTGRVYVDVAPLGGGFERIGHALPAVPDGVLRWSTRGLAAGTWTVRATIADDCGGYYVGYGRYYVDVLDPPDGGVRDAGSAPSVDATVVAGARCQEVWAPPGVGDAGAGDAGVGGGPEAGPPVGAEPGGAGAPEGCSSASGSGLTLPWLAALLLARARAPRRSCRGRARAASARRPA